MPMRIDPSQQSKSVAPGPAGTPATGNAGFGQTLARVQRLQQQDLENFLTSLAAQGQKMVQSMSVADLIDFKQMVKSFLRSTFGHGRQMQEDTIWDYSGRPKVMARITKINKALEELGEQVLKEQAKPLEILRKIDEIRGLIVDLFA